MKRNPHDNFTRSLLQDIESDQVQEAFDSLLGSVRKRRFQRRLYQTLATAAAVTIASMVFLISQNDEPGPHALAYTEINAPGNWTSIESEPRYIDLETESGALFSQIDTTLLPPIQRVDEQGLIKLFENRPILISQSHDNKTKRFWLLEEPQL